MQNRYVGDIGDFGKLGLLRSLHRSGLTIGINWYLVPSGGPNGDGSLTDYLKNTDFTDYDEVLWRSLGEIVECGPRKVAALECDAILPAKHYSALLDFSGLTKFDREKLRARWHSDAVNALRGCDLVFVDPDNGLICPSALGTKRSNKYVLREELADYYKTGASVIYYQHKARRRDAFYIEQHRALLGGNDFPGATGLGLKFVSASQRYYFFILQPSHREAVCQNIDAMLETKWHDRFIPLDWASALAFV